MEADRCARARDLAKMVVACVSMALGYLYIGALALLPIGPVGP